MGKLNPNEAIYGPVADAAATKYGLDSGLFRSLIASESSWNPAAINPQSVNGQNASGIAQFLPSTAAERGVDPFNPYSALDGAASYLSDLVTKYGLRGGIAAYKGGANKPAALAQADKLLGANDITAPQKDPMGNVISGGTLGHTDAQGKPVDPGAKAIWQYSWADIKEVVATSAMGFTLGIAGLLLVVLSIYMLTKSNNMDSVGAVKKLSGV